MLPASAKPILMAIEPAGAIDPVNETRNDMTVAIAPAGVTLPEKSSVGFLQNRARDGDRTGEWRGDEA